MWRRLVIVIAVLFGALAGCVFALTSPRVAESLRWRTIQLARDRFGVELGIAALQIELFPPALEVRGITLADSKNIPPWLTAHSARVIVQPWPSPTGALVVQELDVDGLETDLTRFVFDGKAEEHEPPKRTPHLPVDVLTLHVWNSRAMIRSPDAGPIVFDDVQLAMRPTPGDGRRISLDVGSVSATPENQPLRARLAARASFYGSIDDPQRLAITDLQIENPTIAIRGNGQARMPQMDFLVHIDTTAELERVLTLVPNAPHIGGRGRVQLDIQGNPLGVKGELIADVTQVTVPGRPRAGYARGKEPRVELGDVSVRAHYDKGTIEVPDITIDHPRAGRLVGSASVALSGPLPVHVKAKVKHASLPEILDLAGLPDAWVRLIFDGDVEVAGTLKPFALDLKVDGHGDDLRVGDRSYRLPKPRIALALDDIGLRGNAKLSDHNITLVDMGIVLKGARYVAGGTLDFDPHVGIAVEVDSEHANLADLGSIAGLTLEGEGSLHGAVTGPYRDPTISSIADMKGLVIHGYPVGDGSGELTFHNPVLQLERFTIHRHDGTVQGNGAIDFSGPGMPAKAVLTVDHVDLSAALADIGVPADLAKRLGARVSGEVAIDGPLLAPVGTATLHTQSFAIDGVDMGPTDFKGGFDATPWTPVPGEKPAELAWGQIAMKPQGGQADTRAAYRKDNTLSLIANMNVVPIGLITPFIGNVPMRGNVSGRVNLEGAHGNITGMASARLREWTVYDAHFETSSVEATFQPGKVLLSAELLSGDASGKGVVMLDELGTYEARFAGKRLDFARLLPVTGPVTVTFDGTVVAKGSIAKADSLVADITLPQADVTWKHAKLSSVEPVTMRFDKRTLHITHMKLAGESLTLEVSGDAPLDSELDVHVKGGGALTALKDISPRIQSAEGTLTLDLRTRGTWAAVELDGVATIRGGQVRATNTRQALEDVTADVSFSGNTLTLDGFTAKVGGGSLKMEGQLVLAGGNASDVALRLELARVTIQPMTDATATMSGALQLQGHMDDLLLSGQVKVDQARYTQNIELGSFLPDQGSRPLQVPAMEPSEVVRLAVGITAPNNIIVSNNVLDAELRADLTVTGTSNRIGLLGTVNTLWARARYRNNLFNVERAAVDFTDEYRIFTQFDVRATTKACNIESRVNIYGDSNSYNIVASGSDLKGVVDPQDVLACLQFGIRLRSFEGHEASGATATIRDTYAGGLDALWTVSGMDEKVKRVLPIQLDEVRVTSGWSTRARRTTARILVGKDIGKNVVLRYSRSIEDDTDHNVALEYRLSNLATVQGTWLSVTDLPIADFGLDLRLRWELR